MTAEQPRALIDNFKIPLRPIPDEPTEDFFQMTQGLIRNRYHALHPDEDISNLTPEGMQVALVKDRLGKGEYVEALEFSLGKYKSIISPEEWREALLNSPPEAQPSLEKARKVALEEKLWKDKHGDEPRYYTHAGEGLSPWMQAIASEYDPRNLLREKFDIPLADLRFQLTDGLEKTRISLARASQSARQLASQARVLVKG